MSAVYQSALQLYIPRLPRDENVSASWPCTDYYILLGIFSVTPWPAYRRIQFGLMEEVDYCMSVSADRAPGLQLESGDLRNWIRRLLVLLSVVAGLYRLRRLSWLGLWWPCRGYILEGALEGCEILLCWNWLVLKMFAVVSSSIYWYCWLSCLVRNVYVPIVCLGCNSYKKRIMMSI